MKKTNFINPWDRFLLFSFLALVKSLYFKHWVQGVEEKLILFH